MSRSRYCCVTSDNHDFCTPISTASALGLTLTDLNGAEVSLASLKGKIALLNFWATWCGPCHADIPDPIEELYGQIPSLPVSVFIDRADRVAMKHLGVSTRAEHELAIQSLLQPARFSR